MNTGLEVCVRTWLPLVVALLLSPVCAAENAQRQNKEQDLEALRPAGTRVSLALVGYNYTNRYIDQFSVHGIDGGNIFVSSLRGGGGGDVCCVPYIIGARASNVPVRWQVGACRYGEEMGSDGRPLFMLHSLFSDVSVQMDKNIPANPRYFEVHFYPDGHIEVAITAHSSAPRLLLNPEREDRSGYARCPGNLKPRH